MKCSVFFFMLFPAFAIGLSLAIESNLSAAANDSPSAEMILTNPMTLALSVVSNTPVDGASWYLSVNSAGQACLTIETPSEMPASTFKISDKQMTALKESLIKHDFFNLKSEYGDIVVDHGEILLMITIGNRTHSIALTYLPNRVMEGEKSELEEIGRAVEVFLLVDSWVCKSRALNFGKSLSIFQKSLKSKIEELNVK